jgi:hypothetical protein
VRARGAAAAAVDVRTQSLARSVAAAAGQRRVSRSGQGSFPRHLRPTVEPRRPVNPNPSPHSFSVFLFFFLFFLLLLLRPRSSSLAGSDTSVGFLPRC